MTDKPSSNLDLTAIRKRADTHRTWNESTTCTCSHAIEEHGHDPKYPGSTACTIENCGCIAFEAREEDSDE